MKQICPKCDGETNAAVITRWGNGGQNGQPYAPYICSLCGSLMLIELATGRLIVLSNDRLKLILGNSLLRQAVEAIQERIRNVPDRRMVLR